MKRLFTLLSALAIVITATAASPFTNESVSYRVMYKWGLINKQAGTVTITTRHDGKNFRSELTAASAKWADGIYRLRDTLRGTIDATTYEPSLYEKITHEKNEYKYDKIVYHRSGNTTTAKCTRLRQDKPGAPMSSSEIDLEAEGLTLDMLSAFYYMRSINYLHMSPGSSVEMNVFSGRRKEILTIRYRGIAKIEIGKKTYSTYHITFTFTGDGGKKTSGDMNAWISTDDRRIPLKLVGNLPVGSVQCYYIGD